MYNFCGLANTVTHIATSSWAIDYIEATEKLIKLWSVNHVNMSYIISSFPFFEKRWLIEFSISWGFRVVYYTPKCDVLFTKLYF